MELVFAYVRSYTPANTNDLDNVVVVFPVVRLKNKYRKMMTFQ